MILPDADPTDSQHNAFVQDWLSRWREKHIAGAPKEAQDIDDYDAFESVIELIQETYNYQDHEARKVAVSNYDAKVAMKVLYAIAQTVKSNPSDTAEEIYDALELAYAFLNATRQHAEK